ncbi:glycoside hydrolase [Membranicola marinus]|uniref:Glycoside hydrolase n=1 Tax=Membranihabitans marinus TaxID=1227546 RepID=A0A953HVF2_9BACT|nr:sialidase family protein [Membranihabitans marinus]MBY5956507.1 glycoside hydrolase [Membranihabitans marinus]
MSRKIIMSALLMAFVLNAFCQNHSGMRKVKDFIIYQDASYYSTFPSVIKKEDGEILVAFRRAPNRQVFGEGGNNHVDPNSYLMTVRSRDNGLSWSSEPELMYAHPWGGSQDPCFLLMKDGTILCTSYGWAFLRNTDNLKTPYFENMKNTVFLGGYNVISRDGGESWDGPFYPPNIPPEVKYSATGEPLPAYNRGAPWEGKDGRLYWAVAAGNNKDNIRQTSVYLLTSDDQGVTWEYSCPIAEDSEASFNETSMYETPNGDLVAFLRTAGLDDQACIARSTDGGKSFGPWKKMGFQGHPLQATRLPDNRVLLVYGYRHKPYGIRARILNAECTNYDTAEEFVLRTDGGSTDIGYPWAVVLDDNRVLVTYYYNIDNGTRHIAGTILEID